MASNALVKTKLEQNFEPNFSSKTSKYIFHFHEIAPKHNF